jgi:hypothetical protein
VLGAFTDRVNVSHGRAANIIETSEIVAHDNSAIHFQAGVGRESGVGSNAGGDDDQIALQRGTIGKPETAHVSVAEH